MWQKLANEVRKYADKSMKGASKQAVRQAKNAAEQQFGQARRVMQQKYDETMKSGKTAMNNARGTAGGASGQQQQKSSSSSSTTGGSSQQQKQQFTQDFFNRLKWRVWWEKMKANVGPFVAANFMGLILVGQGVQAVSAMLFGSHGHQRRQVTHRRKEGDDDVVARVTNKTSSGGKEGETKKRSAKNDKAPVINKHDTTAGTDDKRFVATFTGDKAGDPLALGAGMAGAAAAAAAASGMRSSDVELQSYSTGDLLETDGSEGFSDGRMDADSGFPNASDDSVIAGQQFKFMPADADPLTRA